VLSGDIVVSFNFRGATTEEYDQVTLRPNNGQPMRALADWSGGGCLFYVTDANLEGLCVDIGRARVIGVGYCQVSREI
jgi:hypothetical protein